MAKTAQELGELLTALRACGSAIELQRVRGHSLADTHRDLERGDWLVWLAAQIGVERRLIVRYLIRVVRRSLRCETRVARMLHERLDNLVRWNKGEPVVIEPEKWEERELSRTHPVPRATLTLLERAPTVERRELLASLADRVVKQTVQFLATREAPSEAEFLALFADWFREEIPLAVFQVAAERVD